MSTETLERPDVDTSLEVLGDVDLNIDPACESAVHGEAVWHEGPAGVVMRVQGVCPRCGFEAGPHTMLVCRKAWDWAFTTGLRCANDGCPARFSRDEWWTLVEVL